jgi:hypothetical protein
MKRGQTWALYNEEGTWVPLRQMTDGEYDCSDSYYAGHLGIPISDLWYTEDFEWSLLLGPRRQHEIVGV